jgi:hypothetical protein
VTSGKRSVTIGVALASWGALADIGPRVTQSQRPKAVSPISARNHRPVTEEGFPRFNRSHPGGRNNDNGAQWSVIVREVCFDCRRVR